MTRKRASTAASKTPTQLPTQSAWAKGPPQGSSSSAPPSRSQSPAPSHHDTAIPIPHSRRPSVLRNNAGSVRPASVIFGSTDDTSAPLSSSLASTPAVRSFGALPGSLDANLSTPSGVVTSTSFAPRPTISKADIVKLFQNASSLSSQPSSNMSSPFTRSPNLLPPHHQPPSSTSYPLPQPAQLGEHSHPPFVFGMCPPQQGAGVPWSPVFPRVVANTTAQSCPRTEPGGPGDPPISSSPLMTSHQHQVPPTVINSHVPIQPMQWTGFYYPMRPYNQPPYQYGPHTLPCPPIPMFPRPVAPQLPGTPAILNPHNPQLSQSISSSQTPPSASDAPHLSTNQIDFVPGGCCSVRIESEEARRMRENAIREEQKKKEGEKYAKETEAKNHQDGEEGEHEKMVEQWINKGEEEREQIQKEQDRTIRIESKEVPHRKQERRFVFGSCDIAPASGADCWVLTNAVCQARPDVDSPAMVDLEVKALLQQFTMARFDSLSDQIIQWANKSADEKDWRTLNQVTQLVFEKAIHEVAFSEMYARLCRKMMEQISPNVKDNKIKSRKMPLAGGLRFRKYLLDRCQKYFDRGQREAATAIEASVDQTTKAFSEKHGNYEAGLYFDATRTAKRKALGVIKFIGELYKLQMITEYMMHEYVKKLFGNTENPDEEKIEGLCLLLATTGQFLDTPRARAHMDVYVMRMKEMSRSTNISCSMQFILQRVIELRERKWVGQNAIAAPETINIVDEVKEPLWIIKSSMQMPLSSDIDGHCGSLDHASEKRQSSAEPSSVPRVTCAILNLNEEEDPECIKKPSTELNVNTTNGRFRYDRDFLMQFMYICKEKPPALVPMHELGIECVNQSLFPMAHSGSMRHRNIPDVTSRFATDESINLDIGISKKHNFQSTGSKLTNEEHFDLSPGNDFTLKTHGYPQSPVTQMPSQDSPGSPNGKIKNRSRSNRDVSRKTLLSPQEQSSCFEASVPTCISDANANRKVEEDVKDFFTAHKLKRADVRLLNLPREHRSRFVEKLVASALKGEEADARLVAHFFVRATRSGQCTLEIFEEGFTPILEVLDDIAMDAPNAFSYMSIMLKGAGLKEPNWLRRITRKLRAENRLVSPVTPAEKVEQESQTDSSLNMFHILDHVPKPTPEITGGSELDSSMCNTVDQNPKVPLRKKIKLLPRFRPSVVDNAPGDMRQEIGTPPPV